MDRRSFLRVALLGGAGAVATQIVPSKSYFFLGRDESLIRALEKMNGITDEYIRSHRIIVLKARQLGTTSMVQTYLRALNYKGFKHVELKMETLRPSYASLL